jgi:hypothetical protein
MAKFNMADADNYGGNSGSSFFTLKDDRDTARVRFLYGSMDDVEGYAVHQVEVDDDGHRRYVNCLRNYNDPIDNCPFCAANMKVFPKLFIKLYNEDANECQIWERGKSYFQRLASLASRYNPLHDEVIEIERSGKKGDVHTSYEFYPIDNVPVDISDEKFECPDPLGTIILDKTADEMNTFLNTGSFPDSDDSKSTAKNNDYADRPTGRRTPSGPARRSF